MKKPSLKNPGDERGIVTIEASIVMFFFIVSYLVINSIIINLLVQADTRRALNNTINDLSAYLQVIDRAGFREDFKTKDLSLDKYIGLVTDSLAGGDFEGLKKIIGQDIKGLAKNKAFTILLGEIYRRNSREISAKYEDFGIIGGIDGIRFTNVEILEDGESVDLEIVYKWKTGLLGLLEGEKEIVQRASIRPWLNYIKQEEKFIDSIWKKNNFTRGRYFLKKIRGESDIEVLKLGKGLDLYDRSTNTIKEVYSLNIFDQSYSENMEEVYLIKENFPKKIGEYFKKMEKNIEKYGGKIELDNGEIIKLKNVKKELIIVLPEEAEKEFDLSNIRAKLQASHGKISFLFMEKAFSDE